MDVTEQGGKGEGPAQKVRVRVSMPAGLVAAVKARGGGARVLGVRQRGGGAADSA